MKCTPCTVIYDYNGNRYHRYFADKTQAAIWTAKRSSEKNFHFIMLEGATWIIENLSTVRIYARLKAGRTI